VKRHTHNRPGDRCAAPLGLDAGGERLLRCSETATESLVEKLWGGQQFVFAFCRAHADEYAAMGYERVGRAEAPGQLALGAA
jgi:hypothetical protein